jgi:hypothetical protein
MDRKLLPNLILTVVLLLSAGLALAQGQEPLAEEPGSLPGVAPVPPPAARDVQGVAPAAWAFSGGPNYDSGWVSLAQGEARILSHGLAGDPDHYVVDMQFMGSAFSGINQRYYGGADFGASAPSGHYEGDRVGAYWRTLTDSTITVYRRPEDTYAERVRIRIWRDPIPAYDSGWISLAAGAAATTLNHGLGGDADDYVVDLQFRGGAFDGVNQRYYGGADFGASPPGAMSENDRVGAYWRTLTNSTITVYRRPEDAYAAEARVRIWERPTPTYDSGWLPVNLGETLTMMHNIGGNAQDYVVDLQFRNWSFDGVNQRHYGGADFGTIAPVGSNESDRVGAYWRSLTDSSITVYRRPEDVYAPAVRVRIWCFWDPPAPDYDSGWVGLVAGASATTLNHNLGGDTDDYFVDMQYQGSPFNGINRRYHGGTDFGSNVTGEAEENDRVGAYWRTLTNSTISVYRRPDDIYAVQVRIRIWVMPKPDYDSGWIDLEAGAEATTLTHNLWGDYLDYLVDMQYRNEGTSGVNQRYYGGADFGAYPPSGMNANDRVGAYWRGLGLETITVYRRPEDIYAPQVRIRIWRTDLPDYESGWQVVAQDASETWSHNLGGNVDDYLVNMIYYDEDFSYVNQRYLGGMDFGSMPGGGYNADDQVGLYWRSLNDSDITVFRRAADGFADYVRVRIWLAETHKIYLPIVLGDSTL